MLRNLEYITCICEEILTSQINIKVLFYNAMTSPRSLLVTSKLAITVKYMLDDINNKSTVDLHEEKK